VHDMCVCVPLTLDLLPHVEDAHPGVALLLPALGSERIERLVLGLSTSSHEESQSGLFV
jgi:hypothetical protein